MGRLDISSIPKAELHCHIDGIVNPQMLRRLQQQGQQLPITPEVLQHAYPVQGFEDFIEWFKISDPIERNPANLLYLILAQHIEQLKAQKVVYAEIMLGSSELPRDDARLVEEFSTVREHVIQLEAGEIQVEFLVAVGRTVSPARFEEVAQRVIHLRRANLLFGIAVAGWPEKPIRPFERTLAKLHDQGVGIEIHAGEWSGPESVWEALEYGYADRIGHGVALFEDDRLIERFRQDQIHIEFCPTSNLKTGSVELIEDHPIQRARQLGLNYSINTDDPGPFENSMNTEYELLNKIFGFEREDFETIYANTLRARFQPELRYPSITRTKTEDKQG